MFYLLPVCALCVRYSLDRYAAITYSKSHKLIRLVRVLIEMPKRGRLSFGFIDDEEIVESMSHHCFGFILHSICGIKRLMTQNHPKVRPNANGNELFFALSPSRYNDRASIAWQRIISM